MSQDNNEPNRNAPVRTGMSRVLAVGLTLVVVYFLLDPLLDHRVTLADFCFPVVFLIALIVGILGFEPLLLRVLKAWRSGGSAEGSTTELHVHTGSESLEESRRIKRSLRKVAVLKKKAKEATEELAVLRMREHESKAAEGEPTVTGPINTVS